MKTVLINYGTGNLMSIVRALQHLNVPFECTDDHQTIAQAKNLIIPGVGAFGQCMQRIKQKDLDKAIINAAQDERNILGICVGMQILFETSTEFGEHSGLGLIPGTVEQIDRKNEKLPNIGWHQLQTENMAQTLRQPYYYFVHSYHCKPTNKEHINATITYAEQQICAICKSKNIIGTQFHPEKSGEDGLLFLNNFIKGDLS